MKVPILYLTCGNKIPQILKNEAEFQGYMVVSLEGIDSTNLVGQLNYIQKVTFITY